MCMVRRLPASGPVDRMRQDACRDSVEVPQDPKPAQVPGLRTLGISPDLHDPPSCFRLTRPPADLKDIQSRSSLRTGACLRWLRQAAAIRH